MLMAYILYEYSVRQLQFSEVYLIHTAFWEFTVLLFSDDWLPLYYRGS
jgi:hypothetical protein